MTSMSHTPGTEDGARSLRKAFDEEITALQELALFADDMYMTFDEAKEIIALGTNDPDALDGVMRYVE